MSGRLSRRDRGGGGIGRATVERFAALDADVVVVGRGASPADELRRHRRARRSGRIFAARARSTCSSTTPGRGERAAGAHDAGELASAPRRQRHRRVPVHTRGGAAACASAGTARVVTVASTAGRAGAPLHRRLHRLEARRRRADARRRRRAGGHGRDRQRRLPDVRGHADDRALGRQHRRAHGPDGRGRGGAGAATPLGRLLDPDEVAAAVVWLASPEAAAINGQTARTRRRRNPGMSPFRASAPLTERWEHFDFERRRRRRDGHARPPREAERADVRGVRRPARPRRRAAPPRRRRACS